MRTKIVALFNNKGGVGKTSLVYHLAWMYAQLDVRVVAADLDPQANLTAAFLDDDGLEEAWTGTQPRTVFGSIKPLVDGTGDVSEPRLIPVEDRLALFAGDLALSTFEDELSKVWSECLDGKARAFRVVSAFWRLLQKAASSWSASVVLMDLGPSLGAITRASLIAADHVVVPLSPDLFSLRGLQNLGPTLRQWRAEWGERLKKNPHAELALPEGRMEPSGYIVLQHSVRLDRPVKAYEKWIARIPQAYHGAVLDHADATGLSVESDPECLALLRHYRSLMPMAQEARKPMFDLKPADGAIGAHFHAVRDARKDFEALAKRIASRAGLAAPC